MGLQNSGAIKLSEIATEYGGTAPHSMSEYHGKGNAPGSGRIDLGDDFYGTSNFTPGDHTFSQTSAGSWSYSIPDGATSMRVELVGGGGGGGGPGDGNIAGSSKGTAGGSSTASMSGLSFSSASGGAGGDNQQGSNNGDPGPSGPTGGTNPPFNGGPGHGGTGAGNYNCCNGGKKGGAGSYVTNGYRTLPAGTGRTVSGTIGSGGSAGGGHVSGGQSATGGSAGGVHVSFNA
jgi:hypothetical protein